MSEAIPNQAVPSGEASSLKRRTFVGAAIGGVGACYLAALGYPVYRYLSAPVERAQAAAAVTEVLLKDAQKLAAGSALMFKFGPFTSILIHHADGAWSAFDAKCTHMGCTVQFQSAENNIWCACHGGTYDPKTGVNTGGPPPRPLRAYAVSVREEGVLISRT